MSLSSCADQHDATLPIAHPYPASPEAEVRAAAVAAHDAVLAERDLGAAAIEAAFDGDADARADAIRANAEAKAQAQHGWWR